ncbi:radH flavin-dependent halogenase [Penicillium canariense]|uniref:RadH flavin-dependent halogenase n=1 Tax=Penicillium canariense TaxID=189055 RepID=A0A9W9LRR1_9EURO|nr:radH flavin-dependent halogenase [Penicillium canariense]KAJ5174141.1 radH flavin-dependent halogenase [Penicillium canariense]
MDIPDRCTVLVVGGGPGGSYAASVLAREGIHTVLLEADEFPSKPAAYSNFLQHGQHAWNVDRSECDDLMFKHARECGARAFDGVKVQSIEFLPTGCQDGQESGEQAHIGKPVSASWISKNKTTGSIKFRYLVDASGRAGLISTKYMKNRTFNEGLKNVATWGYFEGFEMYGVGTFAEGCPYFASFPDGSGWVWFIPLEENRVSVGVVMEQKSATAKKKLMESPSSRTWLLAQVKEAPEISVLLAKATLVSDVKSASDWSYTASTYASTNIRIVGDAGCFIDPLFSSGIHLALTGAFSAAATICSSIRGDCSEKFAADWHSKRVHEAYARFLLVVASTYGQITGKEASILNDEGESNFDNAFELIRPIIQGSAEESTGKAAPEDASEAVAFCLTVIQKAQNRSEDISIGDKIIRAAMQPDTGLLDGNDIDGMAINARRGALGLVKV